MERINQYHLPMSTGPRHIRSYAEPLGSTTAMKNHESGTGVLLHHWLCFAFRISWVKVSLYIGRNQIERFQNKSPESDLTTRCLVS